MNPTTWNWKRIIGIILLSTVCFIVASQANSAYERWRTRMAAKRAAAVGGGNGNGTK